MWNIKFSQDDFKEENKIKKASFLKASKLKSLSFLNGLEGRNSGTRQTHQIAIEKKMTFNILSFKFLILQQKIKKIINHSTF